MRTIVVIGSALQLAACALVSHDRTHEPVASGLTNACFALAQDSALAENRGIETTYLVQAQGATCFPHNGEQPSHCPYKRTAILGKGSRFTVVEVTDAAKGETGRCWQITARFEDERQLVTIPSCLYEGTQSPIWLAEPKIPAKVTAEHPKVRFDSAYAIPCT